jgi:hypothetical protein
MEEKLDENNVELALVTPKQNFYILKKEELKEAIEKLESSTASTETEAAAAEAPAASSA